LQSPVDTVLAAPAVHRLVADPNVASDVLDAAPSRDEIQHTLAKLRGVTAPSHAVLLSLMAWLIPEIRLREIQGALLGGLDFHGLAGAVVGSDGRRAPLRAQAASGASSRRR